MSRYEFLGDYETHAGLPDGSVVLVSPGDVVDLGDVLADDPNDHSGLWAETEKAATGAPADPAAPAVAATVLDPTDDPINSAPPLVLPDNLTPSHAVPDAPAAETTPTAAATPSDPPPAPPAAPAS